MRQRTDQLLRHRKTRDRALVLPVVGLILLIPPVADIFAVPARIGGIPVALIYVFAVWAVLIGAAALLSRRLREADEAGAAPPDVPDGEERDP